jgi:hypothetical protein
MKYLGHPEATLVTMWVAARHLSRTEFATEADLVAALRPPHLTSGRGLALTSSLSVGMDLGVFVLSEEVTPRYSLSSALNERIQWFDRFDGFARIARRLLMFQANVPPGERSDVAVAVAWLLSRDWRRPQDPVPRQHTTLENAVSTPEQLVTFGRWCRELGFGRPSRGGVMPDPTPAMQTDVLTVSPGHLSARDFVDLLSPTIPTGPRHGLAVMAPTDKDTPDELELFSPVGLALKRLEREGLLRTIVRDDAKERIIFPFPGPTDQYVTITHVEVVR